MHENVVLDITVKYYTDIPHYNSASQGGRGRKGGEERKDREKERIAELVRTRGASDKQGTFPFLATPALCRKLQDVCLTTRLIFE